MTANMMEVDDEEIDGGDKSLGDVEMKGRADRMIKTRTSTRRAVLGAKRAVQAVLPPAVLPSSSTGIVGGTPTRQVRRGRPRKVALPINSPPPASSPVTPSTSGPSRSAPYTLPAPIPTPRPNPPERQVARAVEVEVVVPAVPRLGRDGMAFDAPVVIPHTGLDVDMAVEQEGDRTEGAEHVVPLSAMSDGTLSPAPSLEEPERDESNDHGPSGGELIGVEVQQAGSYAEELPETYEREEAGLIEQDSILVKPRAGVLSIGSTAEASGSCPPKRRSRRQNTVDESSKISEEGGTGSIGRRSKRHLEKAREIVEEVADVQVEPKWPVQDRDSRTGPVRAEPLHARRSGRARKISQRQRDATSPMNLAAVGTISPLPFGMPASPKRRTLMMDPESTPSLTTTYSAAPSPASSCGLRSPPPLEAELSRWNRPGSLDSLNHDLPILPEGGPLGSKELMKLRYSPKAEPDLPDLLLAALPVELAQNTSEEANDRPAPIPLLHTTRSTKLHTEALCAIPFPPGPSTLTPGGDSRAPRSSTKVEKKTLGLDGFDTEDLADEKLMAVCAALDCQSNRALTPQEIAEYCFSKGWLRPSPAVPPANAINGIIRSYHRRCGSSVPSRQPLLESRKLSGAMTEAVFARALHPSVVEENKRVRGTVWFLRGTYGGSVWTDPFEALDLDREEMAVMARRRPSAKARASDGTTGTIKGLSRRQIGKALAQEKKREQRAASAAAKAAQLTPLGLKIRINVAALRSETTHMSGVPAAGTDILMRDNHSEDSQESDEGGSDPESEDEDSTGGEARFETEPEAETESDSDEDHSTGKCMTGLYWRAFSTSANVLVPPVAMTTAQARYAQNREESSDGQVPADLHAMRQPAELTGSSSSEEDEELEFVMEDGDFPPSLHGAMWDSFDQAAGNALSPIGTGLSTDEVDTPATTPGGTGPSDIAAIMPAIDIKPIEVDEPDITDLHAAVQRLAGMLPSGHTVLETEIASNPQTQNQIPCVVSTGIVGEDVRASHRRRRQSQSARDFLRITIPLPTGPAPSPLPSPLLIKSVDTGLFLDANESAGALGEGLTHSSGRHDIGVFANDLQRQLIIAEEEPESICKVEPSIAFDFLPGFSPVWETSPVMPQRYRRSSTPLVRQASTSSLGNGYHSGMDSPSKPDRRRFPAAAADSARGSASASGSPRHRNPTPMEDAGLKQNLASLLGPESVGVEDLDLVWDHVQASMNSRGKRSRTSSSRSNRTLRRDAVKSRKVPMAAWGSIGVGVGCPVTPELKGKPEKARFGQALLERARFFAEQVSCQAGSSRTSQETEMADNESCIGMEDLDQAIALASLEDMDKDSGEDASMSDQESGDDAPGDYACPENIAMLNARHFTSEMDAPLGISPGALSASHEICNPFSPPFSSSPSFASGPAPAGSSLLPPIPVMIKSEPANSAEICIGPCKPMWPLVQAVVYEGIPIFSVEWEGATAVRRIDTDYVNMTSLISAARPAHLSVLDDELLMIEHQTSVEGRSVECLNGIWIPLESAIDIAKRMGVDGKLIEVFLAAALAEEFPPPLPQVKAVFMKARLPYGQTAHDFGAPFGTQPPARSSGTPTPLASISSPVMTPNPAKCASPTSYGSTTPLPLSPGSTCVPCKRSQGLATDEVMEGSEVDGQPAAKRCKRNSGNGKSCGLSDVEDYERR